MIAVQYEGEFESNKGQVVHVRRIAPDDTPVLVDIFENMSPDSRFQRWNQALVDVAPELVWQEAADIANGNPRTHKGLIAFVDTEDGEQMPIGAARYVETGPGTAEVGISLRDDFQGMGIGTRLMRMLALEARERGFRTLTASIRNDNPAIWRVFKRLPFAVRREPEGSFSEVTIRLDRPE